MATWKSSKSFKFKCPNTQYKKGTESELRWEYQTTSDYFTAILSEPDRFCAYSGKPIPAKESRVSMTMEHAKALLEMMNDWNEVYNK